MGVVSLQRALWFFYGVQVCGWLLWLGFVEGCGCSLVVVWGWVWGWGWFVGFSGWCGLLVWVGLGLGLGLGFGVARVLLVGQLETVPDQ